MDMKAIIIALILSIFLGSGMAMATEDFLGAPVIPGAKILKKTDTRLELVVNLPHDKVLAFYKKALKGLKDIRYREWKAASYIEDDSNRPWHSITISKRTGAETSIVIMKDNWTWIMGTLFLRFIGVFIVLLVLFVALSISGAILSRIISAKEDTKA
ncbi:MAG: hypothetical protein DRH12_05725 [Deltaproteobacteria bacterium]|nr:MAG: hypothetical protein DRH12_05725 [Deltaproteobacteria bacterium]RLB77948.1 MAG: hypothetical protein DRH15_10655 [Deltaproteobacteria bacterium]